MKQTVVASSAVAVVGDPSGNPQLADGAGTGGAAVAVVVVVAVVVGVAAAAGHRISSLPMKIRRKAEREERTGLENPNPR